MTATNSTFKFRSYLRFHNTIGKVGAVVSFTELAIRNLRNEYASAPKGREFLERVSRELGVYVTHVNLDLLQTRTSQLHTVSILQQFEEFLADIQREHPARSTWTSKREDQTMLDYVFGHVTGEHTGGDSRTKLEIDLLDHYRIARNRFLHASDAKENKIRDLKERAREHPSFIKLDGPNTYNELIFDDCVICARCSLLLAGKMCQMGRPTDEQIAQMLFNLEERKEISLNTLRAPANTERRFEIKCRNILAATFGMDKRDCGDVVEYLKRGLLA